MKLLDLLNEKFTDMDLEMSGVKPRKGSFKRTTSDMSVHNSREEILADNGWERIGAGAFSSVYANEAYPDRVLKVFSNRDPGWTRFYSMAKRSENPHFPEVARLGIMDFNGQSFYVCLIERLTSSYEVEENPTRFMDAIKSYIGSESYDEYEEDQEWAFTRWPHLRQACDMIKDLLVVKPVPFRYYPDIKLANIMWRGTTPVFSDPVTFFSG